MKYILSLFLTLSVLCTSLSAVEYGYLTVLNNGSDVSLNAGDLIEFLGAPFMGANSQTAITVTLPNGYSFDVSTSIMGLSFHSSAGWASIENAKSFVGPCNITSNVPYLAYKLTRASEVEYKNVNIISLPTATVGAGTHEIVVEASDDLQTWTPVHSSPIGGSKAFFRTRVVEAGE